VDTHDDQLVADYLGRLRAAASRLPAGRGDDLAGEIATHIAEARAAGPAGASEYPAHVRNVLERLGDPEDIVRAAEQPASAFDSYATAIATAAAPSDRAAHGAGLGALEISAIVALLLGGFLAGIGWLAGVVLLWLSPRWRTGDKVLGTLVWPGGLLVPVVILAVVTAAEGGRGQMGPAHLAVVLIFVLFALLGPILVAVRLVRHARRRPAQRTPDHLAPDGPHDAMPAEHRVR
jgi:uncharacterized membrane protein